MRGCLLLLWPAWLCFAPSPLLRRLLAGGWPFPTAQRLIHRGAVYVDGVCVRDPVKLVAQKSRVVAIQEGTEEAAEVPPNEDWYLKFFKPRGVISSHKQERYSRKPCTAEFFPPGAPSTLHNAGRLDGESEGLLLLTTDGHFSHFVTSPGKRFEKEYIALTNCAKDRKPPSSDCLRQLLSGVCLSDGHVVCAKSAEVIDFDGRFARLRLTVTAGRFRMVRRMLRAVGYSCLQLVRTSTCGVGGAVLRPRSMQEAAKEANKGALKVEARPATMAADPSCLQPGEYAPLEAAEVARIYARGLQVDLG
ncbi:unnamed protein product [Effrenium voratum]|nr:unnamed protein product [Effrenium voratum]